MRFCCSILFYLAAWDAPVNTLGCNLTNIFSTKTTLMADFLPEPWIYPHQIVWRGIVCWGLTSQLCPCQSRQCSWGRKCDHSGQSLVPHYVQPEAHHGEVLEELTAKSAGSNDQDLDVLEEEWQDFCWRSERWRSERSSPLEHLIVEVKIEPSFLGCTWVF